MLKTCWDCIAGDQQRRNDDPYSVHLNGAGGTQGPHTQSFNNGNMFPTPTLRARNQIIIKGQMTPDRQLNLAIATGNSTACKIDVIRPPNASEELLEISSFGEVVHKSNASDWFIGETQYLFRFVVNGDGSVMDIFVGIEEDEADQFLISVAVNVNDISMISANGTVEKLIFIFKDTY